MNNETTDCERVDLLARLYVDAVGSAPQSIALLPGAGSSRKYYRLSGAESLIGVAGTDAAENRAFITLSKYFREKHLPVPEVRAVSGDMMYYLQEDLGSTALFDFITKPSNGELWGAPQREALRRTIAALSAIQWEGAKGLDFDAVCFPVGAMDRQALMWDLNYFKYCFLKPSGLEHSEPLLERDFKYLCDRVLEHDTPTFMYRDFQSRNVMLAPDLSPRFIDFQGGRRGPYHYDVASFLWQAKANFPTALREELIDVYVNASQPYIALDGAQFRKELKLFVLLRTLQVLGAYGLRGLVQRKAHFIQSIPLAMANLRALLTDAPEGMPHLTDVLRRLVDMPRWNVAADTSEGLTVRVNSFGFRKSGIPEDTTANGGGFVFDCRALCNPGKYAQYRAFTGRDECVIDFLERDGGIVRFLDHAYALVDASVERYLERGFTDLMVSFGCTGGQHRSVYSAEHMAHHLNEKYGVRVELRHIEQGVSETLSARR
jgi:aminoglycoside/choline kinase family phosphotransferase